MWWVVVVCEIWKIMSISLQRAWQLWIFVMLVSYIFKIWSPLKRNFFERHLTPLKFWYVKIYVPRTPQKKFEANRSGGSLQSASLLFSRFYLLKRWFLTISEVKLWSSGGSNFGCVTIQTSNPTYILKFWGFDPKNPSGFLLDPSWTDMFLRWRFSLLCLIEAVFHHQTSSNIM